MNDDKQLREKWVGVYACGCEKKEDKGVVTQDREEWRVGRQALSSSFGSVETDKTIENPEAEEGAEEAEEAEEAEGQTSPFWIDVTSFYSHSRPMSSARFAMFLRQLPH